MPPVATIVAPVCRAVTISGLAVRLCFEQRNSIEGRPHRRYRSATPSAHKEPGWMRYARGSQRFVFLGVAAAAILLGFQALAGDVRSAKPQSDGKPVEK